MTFSSSVLGAVSLGAVLLIASCGANDGPLDTTAVATAISIRDGNFQTADLGKPLAKKLAVTVTDKSGTGVAGVPVVFSTHYGDGIITDSAVVTDANGVAVLGSWTMGTIEGINTVYATVTGLEPVLFLETAFDPCSHKREFPMPGQLVGKVSELYGCSIAATTGMDSFSLSLPQQQAFKVTIAPASEMTSVNFTSIPEDSATAPFSLAANAGDGASFDVILPAGAYRGSVFAATGIQTHTLTVVDYAITVEKIPENAGHCNPLLVIRKGVVTTQEIMTADCTGLTGPDLRYDSYSIYLHHGTQYTFTAQTTSAKDLELLGPDTHFTVKNTGNTNATSSTITANPNIDGEYELRVVAEDATHFGPYTLQSVVASRIQ